jgi:ribonuclease D
MVCERELGVVLDKRAQTSNWSCRPLSTDQLEYAALDAEVLLALYDWFRQLGVAATNPGNH